MKMRNFFKKIITIFGFLFGLIFVFFAFWPTAGFFLFHKNLLGVDSYHFLYYVIEFSKHLIFPAAGWKMTWFGGVSQMLDNPWLNFILIQPLVEIWGPVMATKIYLIFFQLIICDKLCDVLIKQTLSMRLVICLSILLTFLEC